MNGPCMEFCERHLKEHEVKGKELIDIGSFNMNGSFKDILLPYEPAKYIGVDLSDDNDYVDEICDAVDLIDRFGENSFDVVVSAEMLEHAPDWKAVIHNMKTICRSGGTIFLTTRSRWFPYHGCPEDFSRFEAEDMVHIFSDFTIKAIIPDYLHYGIFVKAVKPLNFKEIDLTDYEVYDISGEKPNE